MGLYERLTSILYFILILGGENMNELLQLIKDNEGLEILPMVATDCVIDDSYRYWMASWSKVRLDKYWCDEERMYSYVEDFDSLVEDYIDYNYEQYEHLTDEELCQLAKDKINSYNWTSAIIVYIEPL